MSYEKPQIVKGEQLADVTGQPTLTNLILRG